jgi:deoxyribose-phosphate aldolase
MNGKEAARLIDISAVRTQHSLMDIEEVIRIAREYRFINVHTLPSWTKIVSDLLKEDNDIFVGAPVGFPSGGHKTEIKYLEAQNLIADGVDEMDIVMNVGKFKNRDYEYVKNELEQLISLAPENVLTKVILEINCLTDDEMLSACNLVIESGADFIKTGTGWVPGDANVRRIEKIKNITHGKIKLKAAGGIRTREEFDDLISLEVERFGINTNSALEIVRSFDM